MVSSAVFSPIFPSSPTHIASDPQDVSENWQGLSASMVGNYTDLRFIQIFNKAIAALGIILVVMGRPLIGTGLFCFGLASILVTNFKVYIYNNDIQDIFTQSVRDNMIGASANFDELPIIQWNEKNNMHLFPQHVQCTIPDDLLNTNDHFRGIDKTDKTVFVIKINKDNKKLVLFPVGHDFREISYEVQLDQVLIQLQNKQTTSSVPIKLFKSL